VALFFDLFKDNCSPGRNRTCNRLVQVLLAGRIVRLAAGDLVVGVAVDGDRDAPSFPVVCLVSRIVADDVALIQILDDAIVDLRRL